MTLLIHLGYLAYDIKNGEVSIPNAEYSDKAAMIVELKWNKTAEGAITQIKNRNYVQALDDYKGEVLLVGINYDKEKKEHQCAIESIMKS